MGKVIGGDGAAYGPGVDAARYEVSLGFRGGGSDKVYHLAIDGSGDAWVVTYANGRRGGTLAHGSKTPSPVPYAKAAAICAKVLGEKVGKGYVVTSGSRHGAGAVAEAVAAGAVGFVARARTDLVPQLLNPIPEGSLAAHLADDRFAAQEKHDGERRPVSVAGGVATAANRRGEAVALPRAVEAALLGLGVDLALDGELVGDVLWVFDAMALADGPGEPARDLRGLGFAARVEALEASGLLDADDGPIRLTETAYGTKAKRALEARVRAAGGEGLAFHRRDAAYVAGRPNGGGDALKHKFYETLSAIVTGVNDRRSVALGLLGPDGAMVPVGNVTVPPNQATPAASAIVEVRYLYAFDGGSLYQPTLLKTRMDVDASECVASQRVFKGIARAEAA